MKLPSAMAQEPPGFEIQKQYSADMTITTAKGDSITQKIYSDGGKIRTEMKVHGMDATAIYRPDLQKYYTILVEQKMVMVVPADKKRAEVGAAMPTGKSVVEGTETVENTSCTKYKITSDDGKIFYFWVDASTKTPIKMVAEDGSFVTVWKNFVVGPQNPELFEVPAGYQVMDMSAMPGMPGGGHGGMPQIPNMPSIPGQ